MSKSDSRGTRVPASLRTFAKITGARLCFGRPVETAALTVIPVASVRAVSGHGGALDARPIGFIEISPSGTRFQRIHTTAVPLATVAAAMAMTWLAGRVAARRRHGIATFTTSPRRVACGLRRVVQFRRAGPNQRS